LIIATTLTLPHFAVADEPALQLPYREVAKQEFDQKKVYIFFSFGCTVCASYDRALDRWAATMPEGWTAEFVPVAVPEKGSYMAARAYYAVLDADPRRIGPFMTSAYSLVHDHGMALDDEQTWKKAVAAANVQGFEKAWAGVTQVRLESALAKLLTYGVDATPSIAIGGQYVITPDNVNGDNNMFLQLANGMVSKVIQNR